MEKRDVINDWLQYESLKGSPMADVVISKLKRLDELEKDINEFINLYLRDIRCENIDRHRFSELKVKLSKVGE